MIQKVTSIPESEFKLPQGVTNLGNYNKMPEPWIEVTRDFYFHWGTMWVLDAIESRQITPQHTPELFPKGNKYGFFSIRIEWYWWGGVAVNLPYEWHVADKQESLELPGNPSAIYEGEIRYFRLGCVHEFKPVKTEFRTLHHTACTKCGQKWSYDSGD